MIPPTVESYLCRHSKYQYKLLVKIRTSQVFLNLFLIMVNSLENPEPVTMLFSYIMSNLSE